MKSKSKNKIEQRPALRRIVLTLPPDLLAEIETYRSHALHRGEAAVPNRMDVIRELIWKGLKHS